MEGEKKLIYTVIGILFIFQILTFVVLGVQSAKMDSKIDRAQLNTTEFVLSTLNEYGAINQQSLRDITRIMAEQQIDFDEELKFLKAERGDFSGIIENSLKGVVSVATESAMGSGFFVSDNGYIVTNDHVLEGGTKINVLTYNQQFLSADLIGRNAEKDVALLKVTGSFNALEFRDSDELTTGSRVIAVGNPLGFKFSVTEGIISGLDVDAGNGKKGYIQTDASLNQGNSGGPLIDSTGKVVGVNNFRISDAENIGFALEGDVVKEIINQLAGEIIV